ncbi:MAG: acetate kinase [candidate division Zixibacteria bacterium]|nr:acetate kinase [candidate division Zixibacteria bacterium]
MTILVLNCGSSSVKYQLIEMTNRSWLAKGMVSRIGMSGAVLTQKRSDGDEVTISGDILDHIMAIEYIITMLLSPNHGVIKDKSEIKAVGHRVVHGGERFTESCLITPEVKQELRKLIELAPLHNPHNIRGINAAISNLPDLPNVAVFDTAFHHKMPDYAYIYGIPYQLYRKYKIRRYGFHGMSHAFVSRRLAEIMDKGLDDLKVITCHLGNGASVTAIDQGISVDTSMGFTPLEGLMMGTRSGDLDPAVILHLMGREELSLHEANTLLNKHSGLLGVSGVSADMREIIEEMESGAYSAQLAFNVYNYRVRKYIGAYAAAMGGLNAIVFTGGIGENAPKVRVGILSNLEFMGITLDSDRNNQTVGQETLISTDGSNVTVAVIPTNEELVIAIDTAEIVSRSGG